MKNLLRRIQQNQAVKDAFLQLAQGRSFAVFGLDVSAKEFFLGAIADRVKKPVLYVVKGPKEQDSAAGNLRVFTDYPVHEFPSIDIIPGQGIHPQVEITAERIGILYNLVAEKDVRPVIVATAHSITQGVIPPQKLRELLLSLKTNMTIGIQELAGRLVQLGYEP